MPSSPVPCSWRIISDLRHPCELRRHLWVSIRQPWNLCLWCYRLRRPLNFTTFTTRCKTWLRYRWLCNSLQHMCHANNVSHKNVPICVGNLKLTHRANTFCTITNWQIRLLLTSCYPTHAGLDVPICKLDFYYSTGAILAGCSTWQYQQPI